MVISKTVGSCFLFLGSAADSSCAQKPISQLQQTLSETHSSVCREDPGALIRNDSKKQSKSNYKRNSSLAFA